jgi:hypothetical protein
MPVLEFDEAPDFEDLAREYYDEAKQFLQKFRKYINEHELEKENLGPWAIDRFLEGLR